MARANSNKKARGEPRVPKKTKDLRALVVRQKAIATQLMDMPKMVSYSQGVDIHQVLIRRIPGRWQVLVKGSRGCKPLVAYFWGDSYIEAWENAAYLLDKGIVDWCKDKWPPKNRSYW